MPKKPANQKEKNHLAKIASLGCLICGQESNVHHIRSGQGTAKIEDLFSPILEK